MRKTIAIALLSTSGLALAPPAVAETAPHILQTPAMSRDLIAFGYAGDLWTVPRAGGRATRLTTGVGVESGAVFSPDGSMIAFTGGYDGNTDVFTIPATGGIPRRVTYHPATDVAIGWSRDGSEILFRSDRQATSRYAMLYRVPAAGGVAKALPLPMAYSGQLSPDGNQIAYSPLAPAFSFNFTSYVSWGNYRGGRAGTVWLTSLPGLESKQIPHEAAADFSPVFLGGSVYFLSGRGGRIGIYRYDPATGAVSEAYRNTAAADIRSLSTDGTSLIFDRLGELYTMTPGEAPRMVPIDVTGDMPDVRPRMLKVGDEAETVAISSTGLRAVVEAHGEILTVPAKHGAVRDITNSPGVMEREPAWSPDGQSIAYFSDESGLYALHVASQTGAREIGAGPVRKFPLSAEPAYYFKPLWSPDSKRIAFFDNRQHMLVLDLVTGKVSTAGGQDDYGGLSPSDTGMAWSPDSRWLAFPRSTPTGLHRLMLYSVEGGSVTPLTDGMADASFPAFDRNGKYLYFLASNNAGATTFGLDMSTDVYSVTSSIYALTLAAGTASPVAPESDDEKSVAEAKAKAAENADATPAGQAGEAKADAKKNPRAITKTAVPDRTKIDLAGLPVDAIAGRIVPLPLPPRGYAALQAGKPGTLYFLEKEAERVDAPRSATLKRWLLEDRKTEKLAEHVAEFQLTADGEKMLVGTVAGGDDAPPADPQADDKPPSYQIVSATAPVKADDGALSLDGLEVRVDPTAEWAQMYREIWRIERAYFYDANFHGFDTVAAEKRLQPYVAAVQSRADLNYIFQEMLTGFSVGHLRGFGGAIPSAEKVPGGLLGADYVVQNGRWCFSKVFTGSNWSPTIKAPLAQPGLNVRAGECILAINGDPVTAAVDIQQPLEGTAGKVITLRVGTAGGQGGRDVSVVPIKSEASLRNIDWIDGNRRKVAELSGGKLAYVYLPDTAEGGFAAFNRYYFAQSDKQGAIIDERFNAGGQVADYVVEVLNRKVEAYWSPRYGAIRRTPSAAIYGPKVMIANEISGSGGDALPWLFKHNGLGPLVGKRTWGVLVGIGEIPVLMDGGSVTSPSFGFFSPKGEWDVENHGVEPDYAVEQDPKAVAAGHDPQLEAAVALAMERLGKEPLPAPVRPKFPVYQ